MYNDTINIYTRHKYSFYYLYSLILMNATTISVNFLEGNCEHYYFSGHLLPRIYSNPVNNFVPK